MEANQLNKRSKGHGINGQNNTLYKPKQDAKRRHRDARVTAGDVPAFYREEAKRVAVLREAQAIARGMK